MTPFLKYLRARLRTERRTDLYRAYVADSLRMIPQDRYFAKRFTELLYPQEEDNRPVEEIIEDIMERAGLTMEQEE